MLDELAVRGLLTRKSCLLQLLMEQTTLWALPSLRHLELGKLFPALMNLP